MEELIVNIKMPTFLEECPLVYDWCVYKGEVFFANLNFEESIKIQNPVFDLAFCATKAFNHIYLKRATWNPKKFTPWEGRSTWNH